MNKVGNLLDDMFGDMRSSFDTLKKTEKKEILEHKTPEIQKRDKIIKTKKIIKRVKKKNKSTDIVKTEKPLIEKVKSNRNKEKNTESKNLRIDNFPTKKNIKTKKEIKIDDKIDQNNTAITLSKRQSDIYQFFIKRGYKGTFSKPEICKSLNIPYITVRAAIKRLVLYNILVLKYNTTKKEYKYSIDPDIYVNLTDPECLSVSYQYHISINMDFIKSILETDPEFGYWRQKELTVEQIKLWIDKSGCTEDSMLEYLRYCRFEMVEINREETEKIDNIFDWFFQIIEKTGAYPRPKEYRPYFEIQLERQRKIAELKEK